MKIVLNEQNRIYQLVKAIRESSDLELEIVVPKDSLFRRNPLNVIFLKNLAQRFGKHVQITEDSSSSSGSSQPKATAAATKPQEEAVEMINEETTGGSAVEKSSGEAETPIASPKRFSVSPVKVLAVVFSMLLLIIIGGGAFVYYYLPQATVTLFVSEKLIEKSTTVTVDETAQKVDIEKRIVPGKEVRVSLAGADTFKATGEKTIGEKATGVVEIRNFTTADVLLGAGTVLSTQLEDGTPLSFILTESVTLPQATTDEDVRVAGKKTASVEATDIGAQYNVSSGHKFSVADFDINDLSAVNDSDFTGGSTEQVKIVSEDDLQSAKAKLQAKLKTDLINKLKQTIGKDELFEEKSVSFSTLSVDSNHEIGDEADSFTVNMELEAVALVVSKEDIRSVLKGELLANIPEGFTLSKKDEVVTIQNTEVKDDKVQVKAKISSLVVPVLDTSELKERLLGKSPAVAESILKSIDNVEGYDVQFWPALPEAIRTFPHIPDKLTIKVEVKAD